MPAPEEKQKNNLPVVTPVDVENELPISFDPVSSVEPDHMFEEPLVFHEDQVRFVADSDVLVDPEGAEEVLSPIVEYMEKNEDFRMLLVGTTAGDDAGDYSITLSNSRAERIKSVLVSKGISDDRIDTLGMGGRNPKNCLSGHPEILTQWASPEKQGFGVYGPRSHFKSGRPHLLQYSA